MVELDGAGRARLAGALGLLLFTLFVNGRYLAVAPALISEEHFRLGERLHATGTLSLDTAPGFFRPPGYPAFVAAVLHLRDLVSPGLESRRAVMLAQGCALSLGALALFLHAARRVTVPMAFAVGLLYAFHPINPLGARALTYTTLHIVCLTIATLALARAVQSPRRRIPWALAAGALWGAATLVRPVSLILPPFILLLARWAGGKGSWRRSLGFTCLFTLGMGLVIGPYTLRNYRLSGRLIAVNAQDGFALWGLAATRNPGGDFLEWAALWREQGMPIFARVSGGSAYSIEALHHNAVPLNDAFRAEAARNMRDDPWRFAGNVLRNLYLFNLDTSYRWLNRLEFVRDGGSWRPRATLAKALTVAMLLLGLAGVVRGLRDRDDDARTLAVIYFMFCVAHSIGIVMERYTYVRLPLVLLALPLVLRGREGDRSTALAVLAAVLLATFLVLDLSIR